MIDASRLHAVLRYEPDTGLFYWLRTGRLANCINACGYVVIRVEKKLYYGHRLAWLYMTGEWPVGVDHRDLNQANNRWCNLRKATHAQNMKNLAKFKTNTSGFKGVHLHKPGKWRACIRVDGKRQHLGLFETAEVAHAAYCRASKLLHGEFGRTG